MKKLGAYFEKSVAWLRGEEEAVQQLVERIEAVSADEMLMMVIRSLFSKDKTNIINQLKDKGFTTKEAKHFLQVTEEQFKKNLLTDILNELHISIFKPLIDQAFKVTTDEADINEKELEKICKGITKGLDIEVIKPSIRELAQTPASELPGIAAVIKRFRENEQFNLDVRKLLNTSIAHSNK